MESLNDLPVVMYPVFILLGALVVGGGLILAIWIDEWFDSRDDDRDL